MFESGNKIMLFSPFAHYFTMYINRSYSLVVAEERIEI